MDAPKGPRFDFVTMLRYARDPIAWWRTVGDAHQGGVCEMSIPRVQPSLVVWTPAGVRDVFMTPPDRLGAYGQDLAEPAVGKHSLLVLEGEAHKRERKRLAPAFHGARMGAYGAVVADAARRHVGRARDLAAGGAAVDARAVAEAISLEVILRAVFGVDDDAELQSVGAAVVGALGAVTPLIVFVKALRVDLGRKSPGGRLKRAQAACDALLQRHVDARRKDPTPRDDILSLVLALVDDEGRTLSDRELLDELKTMLFAGHETTATAIAWTIYEVLRAPDVAARLADERAGAGDAVQRRPYLAAVCDEALRLRPVVADVMRAVKTTTVVAGVEVPAGCSLTVPMCLLHRDPDLYPEPDAFQPERFLARRFAPHEHAPFGGGVRRCLGADFALFEMRIVVDALLAAGPWRLVDASPRGTTLRNITVGPKKPIEITRGP